MGLRTLCEFSMHSGNASERSVILPEPVKFEARRGGLNAFWNERQFKDSIRQTCCIRINDESTVDDLFSALEGSVEIGLDVHGSARHRDRHGFRRS